MKKAFDDNVSRAKPRLRLGAAIMAQADATQAAMEAPVDLSEEVKSRAERAKAPRPTAAEAVQLALESTPPERVERVEGRVLRAAVEPPPAIVEVQRPRAPQPQAPDGSVRREKLKERLKAVRENPRPEPLPETVAEAGVLAVERIALLQEELSKAKALNLALTQDLESARRQSERATEEARSRMEEARRLATEMEARAKLLAELERELAALESERDETLLSLQTARQTLDAAGAKEKLLEVEVARRDQQLADGLAEEERLCDELETSRTEGQTLRRTVETLNTERDTLARQVSELTKERIELLEARKALESVHRALSKAVAR
jgi:DNA repair exonuclease SbcCD ATPase subunit